MIRVRLLSLLLALCGALSTNAPGQQAPPRPLEPTVRGGIYDKPFMAKLGKTAIGGYADTQFRFERSDGATEELTFLVPRFNLFTFTAVSERVRVASEIEIEDAGEEIALELAIVDLEIHPALSLRGGILLVPMGRFNLSHDPPANSFVDRPAVSTEIIPSTWSDAGMGVLGAVFPTSHSRLTYELYAINGLDDGVLSAAGEGTRIAHGKGNFEDQNHHPSLVGRVACSPIVPIEIGCSGYGGPYNQFELEGTTLAEKRNLTQFAIDGEFAYGPAALRGEHARTRIDVPPGLTGLFAERQSGFYVEGEVRLLENRLVALPGSHLLLCARLDAVDFDRDRRGDDLRRVSLGANFKITPQTVVKLNWTRTRERDRFNVETPSAALLLGLASYF